MDIKQTITVNEPDDRECPEERLFKAVLCQLYSDIQSRCGRYPMIKLINELNGATIKLYCDILGRDLDAFKSKMIAYNEALREGKISKRYRKNNRVR